MLLRILLLIFGVYACATAIIIIKAKPEGLDPVLLASYRLLVAAVALTPLFVRDLRRHRQHFGWRELRATILPGALLGAHFVTWIIGGRMTLAVHASLIVNMVPIVMPILLFFLVRERLTRWELLATAIAMGGAALLAARDLRVQPEHFGGDVLCFGSMLLFAAYLALARRNRRFATIWLYLVPLYYVAGVLCLAAGSLRANPFRAYSTLELGIIFGLGLVPTVMGHSILNYSMKHLRGQLVSLVNLGQPVFAGTMAYFIWHESPNWTLYVAAAAVVVAVVLVLRSQGRRDDEPDLPEEPDAK